MTASQSKSPTMSGKDWGLLLTLSVLWGGSFFFNGVALSELPVLSVVVGRVALAAVILWAALITLKQFMPTSPQVWFAFIGMGVLNNAIPFCLIVWGQTQIASGLAAILNATTPLFTILVAHVMTADEKLTGPKLVGIFAGLFGVAYMIGLDVLSDLGASVLAQLAVLVAAVSYAFAGIFGRRFKAMGVTPMQTAAGQLTASSLIMLPVMLIIDQPWTLGLPSVTTIAAMVGLATLSTALAYVLFFRILVTAGATNLLLVTFLIPVSAILLGVTFLGEVLATQQIIGVALIGLGLAVIDGRPLKLLGSKPKPTGLNGDGI